MTEPIQPQRTPSGRAADTPSVLVREVPGTDRSKTCAIAVMAKASKAGVVKTRLTPRLTPQQAADMNTAFLADIVDNLALAGSEVPIDAYMAFGPPGSATFFQSRFSENVGLIEVWFADFGTCLFETIDQLLGLGYGAACVLNSDSPTLPTSWLIDTARHLQRGGDRAVLGPSTDGGYYLLGLKRAHHRLFQDIAWSTELVASQTMQRAREIGLEIVELDSWYDVDDKTSFELLAAELAAPERGPGYAAPHSVQAIRNASVAAPISLPPVATQVAGATPPESRIP